MSAKRIIARNLSHFASGGRPKAAYAAYRASRDKDAPPIPVWDDLPKWTREAIVVAYIEGMRRDPPVLNKW